jgi:hypothetical protein
MQMSFWVAFLLFFDSYLQTTIKYVLITLSADNHMKVVFCGKTKIKWLIVPAIIEVAPYLLTEL